MRKFLPVLALCLSGCIYARRVPAGPVPEGPPLTRADLERLAAAGISEGVLGELLDRRGAVKLSTDDVVALKKAGVGDAVIQKALASERKEPEPVAVVEPVPYYYHYYCCWPGWWWYYPRWYPCWHFGYYYWGRRTRVGIGIGW